MSQQFFTTLSDADRSRRLLRDLRNRTRGTMPTCGFEQAPTTECRLRAVISRSGLFRLGVDLASAALDEVQGQTVISKDGTVAADGLDAVVQFVFVDEPKPQREPRRQSTLVGVLQVVGSLAAVGALVLSLVGAVTVLRYFTR